MDPDNLKKYLLLGLSVVVVFLALWLVYPFMIPILAAIVFALALFPVQNAFTKKYLNRSFSAVLIVFLVLLLVGIPTIWITQVFVKETHVTYLLVRQNIYSGDLFPGNCDSGTLCEISKEFSEYLSEPATRSTLREIGDKIQGGLYNYGSQLLITIPRRILDLFIFVLVLFYLLRDGSSIVENIKKVLPLDEKHRGHLFEKTKGTIYSILYGTFLIAIIEGILSGIMFYLLGFSNPVFWAVVLMVVSVLPIGTWLLWLPISGFLFYQGFVANDPIFFWKGLILFFFGLIILTAMDNFLKPWIIGSRSKTNPIIILLGILGGLYWLGVVGFFVGPIIMVLVVSVFDIYVEMYHGKKGSN